QIASKISALVIGRRIEKDEDTHALALRFLNNYKKGRTVVLLYYMYVDVKDPKKLRDWTATIAKELELKGRIHVATEGINGTIAGT